MLGFECEREREKGSGAIARSPRAADGSAARRASETSGRTPRRNRREAAADQRHQRVRQTQI